MMIRMFQVLAVALMVAAAFFIWRGNYETSFVTGVLGICSFLLGTRFRLKSRINERQADAASANGDVNNGDTQS